MNCKVVSKSKCEPIDVVSEVMLTSFKGLLTRASADQEEILMVSKLNMNAHLFRFFQKEHNLEVIGFTDNLEIANKLDSIFPFSYISVEDMKEWPLGPYFTNLFQFSPILTNSKGYYIMVYEFGGAWYNSHMYKLDFNSNCELNSIKLVEKLYEYYDES